jgi:hypothetical protein
MALQKYIELPTGFICPEAYMKITKINFDFMEKRAWITLNTYKDQEARLEGKEPIYINEFRVFGENEVNQVNAKFIAYIKDVEEDSTDTFFIDFNGNGENDIELFEGQDFTAGTALEVAESIIEYLNSNTTFTLSFTVEREDNALIITAKSNGVCKGALGNLVKISGTSLVENPIFNGENPPIVIQDIIGVDYIPSTFDEYFHIDEMSEEGCNVIMKSYMYIKENEADFSDTIDV